MNRLDSCISSEFVQFSATVIATGSFSKSVPWDDKYEESIWERCILVQNSKLKTEWPATSMTPVAKTAHLPKFCLSNAWTEKWKTFPRTTYSRGKIIINHMLLVFSTYLFLNLYRSNAVLAPKSLIDSDANVLNSPLKGQISEKHFRLMRLSWFNLLITSYSMWHLQVRLVRVNSDCIGWHTKKQ